MATPSSEPSEPEVEPSAARGVFIRVLLILTVLLAILMIAILYFRWNAQREPTFVLVIVGDETLSGAVVTINRPTPNGMVRHASTTIADGHRTITPIFLPPGAYHLGITRNDEELVSQPFTAERNYRMTLDWPTHWAAARAAEASTQPHNP